MEIRFYHLENAPLESALPKLLAKSLERGWRAVVRTRSRERVEALTDHLWTYDERGFLPHGSAADGHPEQQPIWLTDAGENPNGAHVLFLTEGAEADDMDSFGLVCRLFDGRDPDSLAAARAAWKRERDGGHALTYWQQGARGWVKKAEAGGAATGSAGESGDTQAPAG